MYGDADPQRKRTNIFILLGAIGFVAAVAAVIMFWPGQSMGTPEGVEAQLRRNPADWETASALKANYPSDYQEMLRRAAAAGRDGGGAAAGRESVAFMQRFIASKANAIMAAPDRALQRIGGLQVTLIQALRDENVQLCADYTVRGLGARARLSPATMALLSRLAVYVIEAARAGEQPGRTPRPELTQADAQAWLAAMRAIDPVVAGQIENDTATSQPPAGQCRAGLVTYEAVARLPAEKAASVTAYLIRASMGTQSPGR